MKITHICTHDTSGAGIAALRLHKALIAENVDSNYLCLSSERINIPEKATIPFKKMNLPTKILLKLGLPVSKEALYKKKIEQITSSKSVIYTAPFSKYKLHNHQLVQSSDIVNLHWTGGILDYPSFFKNINKPLIWTLHDKNPALGALHLLSDIERYPNLAKFDHKIAMLKKKYLVNAKMKVISPSRFLMNFSKNSTVLGQFQHYHVFNAVDLELYKPIDKLLCRSILNLPMDKIILGFISENIQAYHKGIDLVVEALTNFPSSSDLVLLTVGKNQVVIPGVQIIHLGRIQDEITMPIIYSALDALILPSREDNLPNVMLEAMACGVPVLSFPVGGMLDVIEDSLNGFIAKGISFSALKEIIVRFLHDPNVFESRKIRHFAVENFNPSKQAQAYKAIYKSLLGVENSGIKIK